MPKLLTKNIRLKKRYEMPCLKLDMPLTRIRGEFARHLDSGQFGQVPGILVMGMGGYLPAT